MDISIVPEGMPASGAPASFGPFKPMFEFGTDSEGRIVPATELSSLASRVVYYLLTTKGADPVRPQLGGSVGTPGSANFDKASFAVQIARAILDVQDGIVEEQKNSFSSGSPASKLKSLRLVSIDYPTPDSVAVSILITSESGESGLFHLEV